MRGDGAFDEMAIEFGIEDRRMCKGVVCFDADGDIEIFFLLDLVDLIQQAGFQVLPPSRGADGVYPLEIVESVIVWLPLACIGRHADRPVLYGLRTLPAHTAASSIRRWLLWLPLSHAGTCRS